MVWGQDTLQHLSSVLGLAKLVGPPLSQRVSDDDSSPRGVPPEQEPLRTPLPFPRWALRTDTDLPSDEQRAECNFQPAFALTRELPATFHVRRRFANMEGGREKPYDSTDFL